MVPRPNTGAAKILAEKSFLCFFESDISGDTIDANICPNTGMCSSGDGMGWVKGQGTGLGSCSPPTHGFRGVNHPPLSPVFHHLRHSCF